MAWVDTASETFLARHDERDADDAAARARAARVRAHAAGGALRDAARGARGRAALLVRAARRRAALGPARAPADRARSAALRRRLGRAARAARALPAAARAPGLERRGLAGDADARALGAARAPLCGGRATRRCRRRCRRARLARWSRWAWLVEGAAQWLAGQTRHVRPAIARRLKEGSAPAFPPSRADALLLGGSIFDLLAREEGDRACVTLARGPHPDGPLRALEIAFPRSLRHTESAWRSHLARLAEGSRRAQSRNGSDAIAGRRTRREREHDRRA